MTAEPSDADNFPDDQLAEWFDAEIETRRGKVLLMRLSGMTYAAIAGSLGVSTATARKDYDIALAAHATDSPEKMIARQRAVLTDILQANYRPMLGGDKDAAATILKALDREAKLFGLDAPTRILANVNPVDYSNEAAKLLDQIKQYDETALDHLIRPKELTRDRTTPGNAAIIDAELVGEDPAADTETAGDGDTLAAGRGASGDPVSDQGRGGAHRADAAREAARGADQGRQDHGAGADSRPVDDPDDDDWADVD